MVKKKLATFIVIAIIGIFAGFSLTACSVKVNVPADNTEDEVLSKIGILVGDDNVHSFKTFSIVVPANWTAMDQSDVTYTDKGIEQVDKAGVILDRIPDDEDELDTITDDEEYMDDIVDDSDDNCMNDIEITRYDKNADPKEKSRESIYGEMKQLPDIQINGVTCKCYEQELYDDNSESSGLEFSVNYISQYVKYTTDKGIYDICITKMVDNRETGLSLESEEVMAILNSIQDIAK